MGRVDIRAEGDGHVSATAVYRRLGLIYFIVVIIIDVGKTALAILVANMITGYLVAILLTGIAAVVGHCWSIFIKFKGGLGATAIYGVLASLAFWPFLIGAVLAAILFFVTRKSTISTIILIVTVSIVLFIQKESLVLVLYPVSFILIQFLKRFQIKGAGSAGDYSHELFNDLKRVK